MKTNTNPHYLRRLEDLFNVWEDTHCIAGALGLSSHGNSKIVPPTGAALNWMYLRHELLTRKPLDKARFETQKDILDLQFMGSPIFNMLPFMLHSWSTTSRRAYSLSEDFQRQLELTSIGSVTLNDVRAPFPTFCISLPIPIPWSLGKNSSEIDFLLVEFTSAGVSILGLGKELNGRKFLSDKKRKRIADYLKKKHFDKLKGVILGLEKEYFALPATQFVNLPRNDLPIMQDLDERNFDTLIVGELCNAEHSELKLPDYWKLIIRLVVGVCLHIESLGKSRRFPPRVKTGKWARLVQPTIDPKAITAESMICVVETVKPLDTALVEIHKRMRIVGIKAARGEMPAHFREHYWRRWPGTGDDPDAPRCVEVEWTWVNKHRLPPEGLSPGSEVRIG